METEGKPIPFIEINEVIEDGTPQVRFEVSPQAISLLSSLKDKLVSVVVIAGPYRTGKSFLANRLLKRMKGFEIGPTTNACTKGIWMWSQPVPLSKSTDMIILDTEGLNSTQRDQTLDTKIFSISLLLASMFIYNQIGHIDETSLENMSLVVNLSQNIVVSQANEDDSRIAEFFPQFLWVLRDFSLDLKGRSPSEYLEEVLKPINQAGKDVERKNLIRSKLKSYFRIRDCHCMVRPLADESKLARIEDQPWESLRPQFIETVYSFEQKVFNNLGPKMMKNKALNGEMFLKLTYEYLQSINNGGVPEIMNSLERVISTEARKILEDLKNEHDKRMDVYIREKDMPFDREELQEIHKKIISEIEGALDKRTKDLVDTQKLIELKKELLDKFEKDFAVKEQLNTEKSKLLCTEKIVNFFNNFKMPIIDSFSNLKPTLLKEKQTELNAFMKDYFTKAKGPFKHSLIAERLPNFLFVFFENYSDSVQKLMNEDHNKTKLYLEQAREGEERLRKTVKEYETFVFELQKDKESLKRDLETQRREFEKTIKMKEYDEETLKLKIEELTKSKDSKKLKLDTYNQENYDLQEELRKITNELNRKKQEVNVLQKKIKEMENIIEVKSHNAGMEYSPELLTIVRELKREVENLEDFQKKRNLDNVIQQKHLQELEELRKEKIEQVTKIREANKQKIEEIKQNYDKENTLLKKKLEVITRNNDELKVQIVELQKKLDGSSGKDQQIKNIIAENNKLNEALTVKTSNLETHMQVLEHYTQEIQKASSIQMELEQKLAILNSEKANLISFKETYPYVLKEALKWVTNKKSNLKHSLRNLNEEDMIEIKNCFSEVGLPINF